MTNMPADDELPTLADIEAAAARLAPVARRTPLLESSLLNDRLGGRLLVKAEPLQRTGSFKFRGAYNRIALIPETERRRGVVAYSSGNHAQGVAAAARLFGIPATIVMPTDAPAIKRDNTAAYGARIVAYDRQREEREVVAERLIAATGATLIKPYDDRQIIAGQGSIGLEIAQALPAPPDAVVVPCGGGGLVAGCALALSAAAPGVAVHAAEPEGFDDTARSLAAGARLANPAGGTTLCDALMAPMPGELTFAVNRRLLAGGTAVGEAEVLSAMAAAFRHFKLVVEPGGAVALAAVLAGRLPAAGRTVVVVCSGGNVDADLFRRALAVGSPQGPEPTAA